MLLHRVDLGHGDGPGVLVQQKGLAQQFGLELGPQRRVGNPVAKGHPHGVALVKA